MSNAYAKIAELASMAAALADNPNKQKQLQKLAILAAAENDPVLSLLTKKEAAGMAVRFAPARRAAFTPPKPKVTYTPKGSPKVAPVKPTAATPVTPAAAAVPAKPGLIRRAAGTAGKVVSNPLGAMATLYGADAGIRGIGSMYSGSNTPESALSNPAGADRGMFPGFSRWWNSDAYGDNEWVRQRKGASPNANYNMLEEDDVLDFSKMNPTQQLQLYQAMQLHQRNIANEAAAKAAGKGYEWTLNKPDNPFNVAKLSPANLAMRMQALEKHNPILGKTDKTWLPGEFVAQPAAPATSTSMDGLSDIEQHRILKAREQALAAKLRAQTLARMREDQAALEQVDPRQRSGSNRLYGAN